MKTILCFVYDGFADFESVIVCSGLNGCEDLEVVYISYDTLPLKSSGGLTIFPEKTVFDISHTDDIDGLLIPGGSERELKPEFKDYEIKLAMILFMIVGFRLDYSKL